MNDDLLRDACRRIVLGKGTEGDGQRLYHKLIFEIMDVPHRHAEPGALQEINGRRNFARELMGLFQEGPSDGRTDDRKRDGDDAGERGPRVERQRARGAGRRVPAGFTDPDAS